MRHNDKKFHWIPVDQIATVLNYMLGPSLAVMPIKRICKIFRRSTDGGKSEDTFAGLWKGRVSDHSTSSVHVWLPLRNIQHFLPSLILFNFIFPSTLCRAFYLARPFFFFCSVVVFMQDVSWWKFIVLVVSPSESCKQRVAKNVFK